VPRFSFWRSWGRNAQFDKLAEAEKQELQAQGQARRKLIGPKTNLKLALYL